MSRRMTQYERLCLDAESGIATVCSTCGAEFSPRAVLMPARGDCHECGSAGDEITETEAEARARSPRAIVALDKMRRAVKAVEITSDSYTRSGPWARRSRD